MGLLLMQYEVQKAKQKVNFLQLRGIRLNDKTERYQKRIGEIEKIFEKKKTNITSVFNQRTSALNTGIATLKSQAYDANTFQPSICGLASAAGVTLGTVNLGTPKYRENASDLDKKSDEMSYMTSVCAQLQAYISSAIEAMKEAALAELEALEDAQREPIAEKDAEIQAEATANDTSIDLAKARQEAAEKHLADAVKGSVAHYGLG